MDSGISSELRAEMIPKLYLQAAIMIAIGLFCWWAYDAIGDARETKIRAEYAEKVEQEKQKTRDAEANARQISEQKDRDILEQKASLQSRIDSLLNRPERVRIVTRTIAAPGVSEAATEPSGSPTGTGSTVRDSEDIRGNLIVFAGQCEADREQVINLQDWIAKQAAAWPR